MKKFILGMAMIGILSLFFYLSKNDGKYKKIINSEKVSKSDTGTVRIIYKYDTVFSYKTKTVYVGKGDIKGIKDLGIKDKYVNSLVNISSNTSDTVITEIQSPDTLKYKDKFINIKAVIKDKNTAEFIYNINEEFDLYNFTSYRHHFLWFRWGKSNNYVLVPYNPKTKAHIKAISVL